MPLHALFPTSYTFSYLPSIKQGLNKETQQGAELTNTKKRLEHLIESVGVGLGGAAIVSAAVQNPVEEIIKNPEYPLREAGWQIVFIVVVSAFFGYLFGLLTWLYKK
ncbi:MAG: hypothetical protein WBG70_25240 [Spirulinaceae cyanobacterium]